MKFGDNIHSRRRGNLVRSVSAWVMALFLLSALAVSGADNVKSSTSDKDIELAVDRALRLDLLTPGNQIDLKIKDGVVTLQGTVTNLLAKERAAKVAGTVKGVRAVVNLIQNSPVQRADGVLKRDVQTALAFDAATDVYPITTEAKDGKVTLSGTVESWQQKQLTLHVAKGVDGVREVVDDIKIVHRGDRPDSQIEAEIEGALEMDVWVDPLLVTVAVDKGAVNLSGTVGSVAEKDRVYSDAWIAGVKSVTTDGLEVEPWAKNKSRRSRTVEKTDDEIKAAVRAAFVRDPRLSAFDPDIICSYGIVTLSGVVDNLKAKKVAANDARNTVGVKRVHNLLKVRGEQKQTDEQLAKDIKAALERNVFTKMNDIEVSVTDGVAKLDGRVRTYLEKSEAESVAQKAEGITDVRNNLVPDLMSPAYSYFGFGYDPLWSYDPYYFDFGRYARDRRSDGSVLPYINDAEIKQDVKDEMFWSPFVDAEDISIKVQNGTVTLTGAVDSLREFWAATENAYEGGATYVVNNLSIE